MPLNHISEWEIFFFFLPSLRIVYVQCTLKGATCIKQQASAAKTLSRELNTLASAAVQMNRWIEKKVDR